MDKNDAYKKNCLVAELYTGGSAANAVNASAQPTSDRRNHHSSFNADYRNRIILNFTGQPAKRHDKAQLPNAGLFIDCRVGVNGAYAAAAAWNASIQVY